MTTILYFRAQGKVSARYKLEGACAYGRQSGWNIQIIDPGMSEQKAADLVQFWLPKGVIVECGSEQNHYDPGIFGNIPIVFLDRNPKTLKTKVPCVTHDSAATARVAARELLSLKLTSYAYVPWPEPRFWSAEREHGFAEALRLNNCGYVRFNGRAKSSDARSLQRQLGNWLVSLPKPVGIFAVNDFMAAQTAAAANRIGLKIPDDLAIVGVDNDELVCETSNPTLSSVMPNFHLGGQLAAQILAREMDGERISPKALTFGPLRIVRRASTYRIKRIDREVLAALDQIRRESCNGLKARDVAACFSCSRRMAEIRFRAATGKSPLEAILDVRRERAMELLSNPLQDRTAIANLCGYSSANALMNFLRQPATHVRHHP